MPHDSERRKDSTQWKNSAGSESQSWLYMRTIESFSAPEGERTTAAGVAVEPAARVMAVPVVLSDFQTIQMTPPRAQEELKRIQAHFMSLAQCAQQGSDFTEDRERLYAHDRQNGWRVTARRANISRAGKSAFSPRASSFLVRRVRRRTSRDTAICGPRPAKPSTSA